MSATTGERSDLDAVMALLKQQKHTGEITVHLLHGTPKRIDFPKKPQTIVLDQRG